MTFSRLFAFTLLVAVTLLAAVMAAACVRAPDAGGQPVRLIQDRSARQPARAVFHAIAPGTATLSAISDTACLHAHPACSVPQQVWTVTVVVSAR